MTSDSRAISGVAAPTAPVATDDTGFGVELVHRVQPRSIVHRRLVDHPLLGAIGRSSVGFGRAIGRAGALRPVVTVNDLNSLVLRPPSPRRWSLDDPIATERLDDASATRTTTRTASASAAVPVGRSVARRTWTDRLLDASAATPGSPAADLGTGLPTEDAAGFVATGDRKLDALRRMLHDGAAPAPPATDASRSAAAQAQLPPWLREPVDPDTSSAPFDRPPASGTARPDANPSTRAVTSRPGDVSVERRVEHGTRGDTAAGKTTAPGRLGERLRPEATDVGAATVAYTDRRRNASRSPAPPPMPTGGSSTAGRSAGSGGGRTSRGRGRSPQTRKMDALRRMLEDSGKLPRSEPPPDGGTASPSARVAPDRREPPELAFADVADAGSAPDAAEPNTAPGDTRSHRAPSRDDRIRSLRRAAEVPTFDGPDDVLAVKPVKPVEPVEPHAPPSGITRSMGDAPVDRAVAPSPSRPEFGATTSLDAAVGTAVGSAVLERGSIRPPIPGLPGRRHDADATLRRVTLPRAMSSMHRPPTLVPTAAPEAMRGLGTRADNSGIVRAETVGAATTSGLAASDAATDADVLVDRPARATSDRPADAIVDRAADAIVDRAVNAKADRPVNANADDITARRPGADVGVRSTAPLPEPVRPAPAAVDRLLRSPVPVVGTFSTVRVGEVGTASRVADVDRGNPTVRHGAVDRGAANLLRAAVRGRPPVMELTGRHDAGTPPAPVDGDREVNLSEQRPVTDGRPPTSAAELSDRFMAELAARARSTPAPLPVQYEPMASVIAGERRVRVSTDDRSRRALRAVGRKAATTGDVIHLDPRAAAGPERDEVIAHELTHVAHPSPAPRFFDDLDDTPEERRAEEVARIMARSPLAPSSVASAPSQSAGTRAADRSHDVVRRSPAARGPQPGGGGSNSDAIDAESLAARITGTRSARGPSTGASADTSVGAIRRKAAIGGHRARPPSGATPRPSTANTPDSGPRAGDDSRAPGGLSDEDFMGVLERNLGRVTRLLERRVLEELERRGGRFWRGF